ncbi:MAG: competence/damage-inducible protein A [Armatimonadota bacterium]|jgi:molybdenum cofactor synthesis domain-containing protein|nr:competence/damage-inducible protein A [Armatimonadota bacterium]
MGVQPRIELFSIGTELALGRIQDTNSYWMAQQISQMGGEPRRITVLVDDLEEIVAALRGAVERGTTIAVTTGGLGPTPDDLTVAALAKLVGCETVIHEPTLQEFLKRRGIARREDATPNLLKMATVPAVAQVYHNPAGWAPCIRVDWSGCTFLTLPGPPREVMPLFTLHVAPFIAARLPGKTAAVRVAVALPESELAGPMQEVMRQFPGCYLKAYVALRAGAAHPLPLDIVARGEDEGSARDTLQQAMAHLAALVQQKGQTLELWEHAGG